MNGYQFNIDVKGVLPKLNGLFFQTVVKLNTLLKIKNNVTLYINNYFDGTKFSEFFWMVFNFYNFVRRVKKSIKDFDPYRIALMNWNCDIYNKQGHPQVCTSAVLGFSSLLESWNCNSSAFLIFVSYFEFLSIETFCADDILSTLMFVLGNLK